MATKIFNSLWFQMISLCFFIIQGCPDGKYGMMCMGSCEAHCKVCTSNSVCNICDDQYYELSSNCYTCTSPCHNCETSATNCLTCIDSNQSIPSCSCNSGYIMNSSKTCDACQSPCSTCQTTITYCLSCISTYTYDSTNHSCYCQSNQFELVGPPKSCQDCLNPCSTCSTVATHCNSCISGLNRHLDNNSCLCDDTYYNDGICKPCVLPCINCSALTVCTSCNDSIHQNIPNCLCQDGYFMESNLCQQCVYPCTKCEQNGNYCTDCASTYELDSINHECKCPNQKYKDTSQTPVICLDCNQPCSNCELDASHCLTCIDSNQITNSNYQCVCMTGFVANGVLCDACQNPCTECFTNKITCTQCSDIHHILNNGSCECGDGWINDSNYVCQPCLSPCATCQIDQNHCTTCKDVNQIINTQNQCICKSTYYANTISTCAQCTQPCLECDSNGCLSCIDANQVIDNNQCICIDGYVMINVNCYECQIPCTKCLVSTNYCTECSDINHEIINGQCKCKIEWVDDQNNGCEQCEAPCLSCVTNKTFCQTCTDPNHQINGTTCECKDKFYSNTISTCQNCTEPCDNCDINGCLTCIDIHQIIDTNKCICQPGYVMIEVNCQVCQYPCKECVSSTNYCTKCQDIHHIVQNGDCVCEPGWVNDSNKVCQQCSSPCKFCQNTTSECTDCLDINHELQVDASCECKDTYYSNTTSTCQSCQLPCQNCDFNGCLTCIDINQTIINHQCVCLDGYFQNNNICIQCQLPCTKCENDKDHCLECYDINQILVNNKCVCQAGLTYSMNGINCTHCQYPCLECTSNPSNCLSCIDNSIYILEENKCVCQMGLYELNGQCLQCAQQCSTCVNVPDKCLTCSDINHIFIQNDCFCQLGYFVNVSMRCQKCEAPCETCETNYDYCTSCVDYKAQLQDGQCFCEDGYYFDNNFTCKKCFSGCKKCVQFFQCTECQRKYYLDVQQCKKCIQPCSECIDYETCTTCMNGYYLNSDHCEKCKENCLECLSDQQCIVCADNYFNTNGICEQCLKNCETCEITFDTCTSCKDVNAILKGTDCSCKLGYFEQDFTCLKCSNLCKICSNSNNCLECFPIINLQLEQGVCKCADGYFNNSYNCQQCDQACKTCGNSANNCTSCDFTKFQIFLDSQCVCQSNYYLNDSNQCQQCDSQEGKLKEQCKYQSCSDNIWTFGDECDDGNVIARDGCTFCKIDPNYKCINEIQKASICYECQDNCEQCIYNTEIFEVECQSCLDGYFLVSNVCNFCSKKCLTCKDSASNCVQCRFYSDEFNQCQLCESKHGYYSNYNTNLCYSQCGDSILALGEGCDDGNNLSHDGCNQNCQIEEGFLCQGSVCFRPQYPVPSLYSIGDTTLYNNIRQFNLEYNLLLNISSNINIQNEVYFSLKNNSIQNYPFTFTISQQYNDFNFSAIIILEFNQSLKDQELFIFFNNSSNFMSLEGFAQQINNISLKIQDFQIVEEETKQQVQLVTQSSEYTIYFMGVMGGSAILFGGLDVFYNLLDTIQMLSYLKYVNTQLPYNLQQFFELFGFAQLNFIQKYFNIQDLLNPLLENQSIQNIPKNMQNDGLTSLFIINGASILTVWLSLLSVYIISKYLPMALQKVQLKFYNDTPGQLDFILKLKFFFLAAKLSITSICYMIMKEFFFSAIFRVVIATAYDYCFTVLLQIYQLDLTSQSTLISISSALSLLALTIYLFTIYVIIKVSGQSFYSIENYQNRLRYGSLYDGIKRCKACKYYNSMLLCKKFFFMIILIFGSTQPIFQVFNLAVLNGLQSLLLIFYKPLGDIRELQKQFSCEINLSLTLFMITGFAIDEELQLLQENQRILIGWICIGSLSIILLIQLVIDAIQQWNLLVKKYKVLKKIIEKLKKAFKPNQLQETHHNVFMTQT